MPAADELPEGTDTIIEGAGVGETADEPLLEDEDAEPAAVPGDATDQASGGTGQASGGAGQASGGAGQAGAGAGDLRGMFFGRVDELTGQAGDKAREFAQAGKDRATSALDDVVRMVEQAAGEIDSRLGAEYGDYARWAAESIGSFSDAFKAKDVDDLFADAREIVRKSPAVAIGAAAAVGFVVARIVRAGLPEATAAAGAADRDASKA